MKSVIDSNNRSASLQRRSTVARVLVLVMCFALATAGIVLPDASAHAAQHVGSSIALADVTDLASDKAGDLDTTAADLCTVAGGCDSSMAAVQAGAWRAPEGAAAPGVTGRIPCGGTVALLCRPPKSLV
jgi:hypothetical protein